MIYMNVFDKKSVHDEEFQNKLQEEVRKNAEQETDIQEGIAVFLLIIYLFTYWLDFVFRCCVRHDIQRQGVPSVNREGLYGWNSSSLLHRQWTPGENEHFKMF